ncbi:hypothetical protein [Flavobacterium sp.]|uniref:hypothetical protein n=1 Tax=Flavobacterium sp. TaxID=239 RepID=UPI00286B136A|nr:hypothetical protein [Flavobacterium sp.]
MNKVPFINNHEINLTLFKTIKNYGILIKSLENNILKTNIHYEIEVECIDHKNQHFIFEINQKQVFINNTVPDSKIENLLYRAGQTLYPLQLNINKYGQISGIVNYKYIKKRWLSEKENIKEYYNGETVQKIIDAVDVIVLDENQLLQSLYKNWFFTLFFSPLYISYTDALSRLVQRDYPIFGDKSAKFEAIHTINENCSPTNKIIINAKGKATDNRTIDEVLNGDSVLKYELSNVTFSPIESELEIEYSLNATDRSVFLITANFKTKIDKNNSKTTIVEICEL